MLKLWPHARLQQLSWNCIHWCSLWSWRYLEAQGIRFDLSLPTLTFIITLWKKTSKIEAPMFDGKAILLWHCVQSHFWASGVIVFCVTSLEMMLSEGNIPSFLWDGSILAWSLLTAFLVFNPSGSYSSKHSKKSHLPCPQQNTVCSKLPSASVH